MFLVMAVYSVLAFGVVLLMPRGSGEADTGLSSYSTTAAGVSVA
jgi:hypothetical protein